MIKPLDERNVLNAGLCALMAVEGTDITPAQAARTSYRSEASEFTDDQNENLVDYLIRHHHDTPVEFAGATFYMVMPIFVARQMVRHRTSSINEESLRYVEARSDFWVPLPEECNLQSTVNKQGSSREKVENEYAVTSRIFDNGAKAHEDYEWLLKTGLAKELCRTVLPLGQYTAWYWKANLRNVFHLLHLRLDEHAQYQIRVYAEAMLEMLKGHFPNTIRAWENHVLNAVTFSQDECKALSRYLKGNGYGVEEVVSCLTEYAEDYGLRKTRQREFQAKLERVLALMEQPTGT